MTLYYTPSPAQYEQTIAWQMKRKAMKPLQIILSAVLFALPVLMLLLCLAGVLPWDPGALVPCAAALALGALNLLIRTRFTLRAHREFEAMRRTGKIPTDYFTPHTLSVSKDGLEVSFSSSKASYPWSDYNGLFEHKDTVSVCFGGSQVEFVPLSAFRDNAEKERFYDEVCGYCRDILRQKNADARSAIPDHPRFTLNYSYNLDTYIRDQRNARRAAMGIRRLWTPGQILGAVCVPFLVYGIVTSNSPLLSVLEGIVLLVLALPYIILYTPLTDMKLRQEMETVLSYRPSHEATLYVGEHSLKVLGDIHCLDIPFTDIRAVRQIPGALAVYLAGGVPLTIRTDAASGNSAAFVSFMMRRFQ